MGKRGWKRGLFCSENGQKRMEICTNSAQKLNFRRRSLYFAARAIRRFPAFLCKTPRNNRKSKISLEKVPKKGFTRAKSCARIFVFHRRCCGRALSLFMVHFMDHKCTFEREIPFAGGTPGEATFEEVRRFPAGRGGGALGTDPYISSRRK